MIFAILIPVSLCMGVIGLAAFLWALRDGQYDDPDGAANRILLPQDPPIDKGEGHGQLAAEPGYRNSLGRL